MARNPIANAKDIQESIGIEEFYKNPIELAKKENKFDDLIKTMEEKYKDHNFQINGKIYEYWKKKQLEN